VRALFWIGILSYPAARVDHRFKDGDTIRLSPLALTAHITAGHTRGCTSWSFPVRDGDRVLNVVSVCGTGCWKVRDIQNKRPTANVACESCGVSRLTFG
jgi:hypothetical protein